jgi:hypothetical protein
LSVSEKLKQFYWNKSHRTNDNGEIERICTKCKRWILENNDNFYLRFPKKPKKGFSPKCIICFRKDANDHRIANRDQNLIDQKKYYDKNKDKLNKGSRDWARDHKDRNIESIKKWYEANPGKQRQYSSIHRVHDITDKEWESCLKVFNYKCAYCGITEKNAKIKYKQALHKDHGDHKGYNDLRNALPACKKCNSHKWQYDLEIWFREQEFFDEEKLQFIKWWISEGYKDFIEDKPPYKIIRKRNEGLTTYYFGLWKMDELRNPVECLIIKDKKKDLQQYIQQYFNTEQLN